MEQKKRIRIFISSTFKDMQHERDIIVQEVLLPLRAEAERRGGSLSWVDLRWGIRPGTDTEMVIRTCLSEIEDCHPFFIGLVGHRYGWSPMINEKLEERLNRQFREAEGLFSQKKSLTEMEMRYNLLLSIDKGKNFFYFKCTQRGFWRRLLDFFFSKKASSSIEHLRIFIKDKYQGIIPEYSLKCSQDDEKSLKKLVYADIRHIIDEIFPETSCPETMAVRYHQENFLSMQDGFFPRKEIMTSMKDWVDTIPAKDDHKMECLLLKGDAGVGKTTLLAQLIHTQPSDTKFLYHFVGASMKRETPSLILRDLINQICSEDDSSFIFNDVPDNTYTLCELLGQRLSDYPKKIIIVLDNIDAIECDKEALVSLFDWLPLKLSNTKYILSSCYDWRHLKDDFSPVNLKIISIPELEKSERIEFASIFLAREYGKDLNQGTEFREILLDEIANYLNNPRLLNYFLNEIAIQGLYGNELNKKVTQLTYSSNQLLDEIFTRIEQKTCGEKKARKMLLSIALTDYGLQDNDVTEICNDEMEIIKSEDWSILYWNIKPYFQSDGLVRFQGFFRDAVLNRYQNAENASKQRRRLAKVLESMYRERGRHYELEFMNLYLQAGDYEDLYRCISDWQILLYLYNNDKDKLFDYLKQLKNNWNIDNISNDINASISNLKDEKKIGVYEILSIIFCDVIPVYSVAIDTGEKAIRILESIDDSSLEWKKRLARNYLNEAKLYTTAFRLPEAESSYQKYEKYISSQDFGEESDDFSYEGLIVEAQIYNINPNYEIKKKAIPLYMEFLSDQRERVDVIQYVEIFHNLLLLLSDLDEKDLFMKYYLEMEHYIKSHFIYGTHLYFRSIEKLMSCKWERLRMLGATIQDLVDYIDQTEEIIHDIVDLYGGECLDLCNFYLYLGTANLSLSKKISKKIPYRIDTSSSDVTSIKEGIDSFYSKMVQSSVSFGHYNELVTLLYEKDSIKYAEALHSLAFGLQNCIEISPLDENILMDSCISIYLEVESVLTNLFPQGCWTLAKLYNNVSDLYKKKMDFVNAEKYISKAIQMKQKYLPSYFSSLFKSYTRQIDNHMYEIIEKDLPTKSPQIKYCEQLISQLQDIIMNESQLSDVDKEKRMNVIVKYKQKMEELKQQTKKYKLNRAKSLFSEISMLKMDFQRRRLGKDYLPIYINLLLTKWEDFENFITKYQIEEEFKNEVGDYTNDRLWVENLATHFIADYNTDPFYRIADFPMLESRLPLLSAD